jgi:hypothetical protein
VSTPETASTPVVGAEDALVITYLDGHTERAERLGRPGLLIRMERAYPELDVSAGKGRQGLRMEHLFFLAYTALRLDRTGDARPGDDLLAWIDTVEGIEDEANPTEPPPVVDVQAVAALGSR